EPAAVIVTQPLDRVATLGGTAVFSVQVTGGGLLYQWFHDGNIIAGATGANLELTNLTVADAGQYFVRVGNQSGSLRSGTVTLKGTAPAPAVTMQPTDVTTRAGQSLSLSVAGTGTSPLAYRWRRNGVS